MISRNTPAEYYRGLQGVHGLDPEEKCIHGVYDPHRDGFYCSLCNPVSIYKAIEPMWNAGDRMEVRRLRLSVGVGSVLYFENRCDEKRREDNGTKIVSGALRRDGRPVGSN